MTPEEIKDMVKRVQRRSKARYYAERSPAIDVTYETVAEPIDKLIEAPKEDKDGRS